MVKFGRTSCENIPPALLSMKYFLLNNFGAKVICITRGQNCTVCFYCITPNFHVLTILCICIIPYIHHFDLFLLPTSIVYMTYCILIVLITRCLSPITPYTGADPGFFKGGLRDNSYIIFKTIYTLQLFTLLF